MEEIQSIGSWWMWAGFGVFVIAMLAIDLFALGRKGAHKAVSYTHLHYLGS